jgi:hypothetical protein
MSMRGADAYLAGDQAGGETRAPVLPPSVAAGGRAVPIAKPTVNRRSRNTAAGRRLAAHESR